MKFKFCKIWKIRPKERKGRKHLSFCRLLQELVDVVAGPLTTVMRKSLESREVPEDWRTANVCPIYKKGAKDQPGNY